MSKITDILGITNLLNTKSAGSGVTFRPSDDGRGIFYEEEIAGTSKFKLPSDILSDISSGKGLSTGQGRIPVSKRPGFSYLNEQFGKTGVRFDAGHRPDEINFTEERPDALYSLPENMITEIKGGKQTQVRGNAYRISRKLG